MIWKGITSNAIIPAVVSALLAILVGAVATWLVYFITRGVGETRTEAGFRRGQIGSASLVSLAHGTNDAQKTMGIIFLALMSYGSVSKSQAAPPTWVIIGCAIAMASGTYLGGWRIIRTLGKGLVEIKSPQGMAAESSSAAIILLSAHFGYALSTTQVCTGSVMGSGLGKPGGEVRWGVAGRMAVAWLVTLPLAGLVGAVTYWIVHGIGGYPGAIVGFGLLVAASAAIYIRSRKTKVDQSNVNAEWEGSVTAGLDDDGGDPPSATAGVGSGDGSVTQGVPHERVQGMVQLRSLFQDPDLCAAGRGRTAGAVRSRDPFPSRRRWSTSHSRWPRAGQESGDAGRRLADLRLGGRSDYLCAAVHRPRFHHALKWVFVPRG